MKVVDSHIHFWDLQNGYNDWVNNTDLPKVVTPDSLNTNAFVHIEAHSDIFEPLCEYSWLKSKFPCENIKVVAFADFTLSLGEFEKSIEYLAQYEDIIGVRQIMSKTDKSNYSPFDKEIPRDLNKKLTILKDNNLVFEAQMYPEQFLPLLDSINNSGVKIAIEHFGLPLYAENGSVKEWQTFIKNISQNKNWYLKLSGFDLNNDICDVDRALDFIFDYINQKQLCYGSNYPVSYTQDYKFWQNYLRKYINNEKVSQNIFCRVASDIYSIND
ncbi:amidohydrolase family protein [Francisella adeliensis]|uniref:Amidohydrolase n=1 Tax=Francisella adeliensis TaxID=2007306 RepID=A0A2Z4Y2J8_9GAMM|nr:amidohydrolase family protein [Francisella adeliensis]AXA34755.1 amidohydrolase [Francisella adeliensis]MBK2084850.1 amidohydrolase family protein [Francisella adeliensis]MBK2096319.1 amidohydrolase family protein [Francisella adeliensis]QIW12978.1 amidohydrolase family protein [Francisella adeliensis]QIW14858.1 amidohydrolase family protein [Francisella adeliensis]